MMLSVLFFAAALAALVIALQPAAGADWLVLSLISVLVGAVLLVRAILRRRKAQAWIVVDGSNVLYWRDETPDIDTVRAVVADLKKRGFVVAVVFDANAGYLVSDVYLDDKAFAKMLKLPEKRVMVVPKGMPADPFVLRVARGANARIVTNDRYRDWLREHPELLRPNLLIKGHMRDGAPVLDLPRN